MVQGWGACNVGYGGGGKGPTSRKEAGRGVGFFAVDGSVVVVVRAEGAAYCKGA